MEGGSEGVCGEVLEEGVSRLLGSVPEKASSATRVDCLAQDNYQNSMNNAGSLKPCPKTSGLLDFSVPILLS